MKGYIFVTARDHLLMLAFEDKAGLTEILRDCGDGKLYQPYWTSKGNKTADVVIGAIGETILKNQPLQLIEEAPKCPKHGCTMKPSQHGGFFCPKRDMNDYCKISVDGSGVWKGIKTTPSR